MDAEYDKKDDIYRYEMMMPFKGKWDCYHIPLKAQYEGGYDIIMANKMMGLLPPDIIDKGWEKAIDMLSDNSLWNDCEKAIETALSRFEKKGIELPEKEYLYSILLANPDNAYTIMNEGYCGDGGIPGYIIDDYIAKAREYWGDTAAFKEFEEKNADRTSEENAGINTELMKIFAQFGGMKDMDPASPKVQKQVKKLQDYITDKFYKCTNTILSSLGHAYSAEGEMNRNIDKAGGKGTGEFVDKAIQIYCSK